MVRKLFEKFLPLYIRLWPSSYILAMWSHPRLYSDGTFAYSHLSALRITIRKGPYAGEIAFTVKKGVL